MNYTTHYNYAMPESSTDRVDIDVLNQNFSDIDGDIYETKQLADSNDDRLDTAEANILDNTDSIDSLGRRVDALDVAVGDVDSGLTKDVAGLVADVGLLESAVSDLDAQINTASTGLDDRVEAVEDTLSSLQTTVGGISDDLDTCEGVVAGHTTDISALDAALNTPSTGVIAQLDNLDDRMGDAENDIRAIEDDVSDLQRDVGLAQTDISNMQGDIATLKTKKYEHNIILMGSSISIFCRLVSTDNRTLVVADVIGLANEYTLCDGYISSDRISAFKLKSDNKEIDYLICNPVTGYDDGITASVSDIITSVHEISCKEI